LWDVATSQMISEFVLGNDVDDQQVSCLWQGNHLLTVSLSGFINYLDVNNPSKPLRIVKGHNKSITAFAITPDKSQLITGSHDGHVVVWDYPTGDNEKVAGRGHCNQVQDMDLDAATIYTCGMDDVVKSINMATKSYGTAEVKMDSQPRGIAVGEDGLVIVANIQELTLLMDCQQRSSLPVDFEPSCIAINTKDADVAVGGAKDNKVHIFMRNAYNLSHKTALEHLGPITDVKYSPCGSLLAACDTNRKIIVYRLPGYELAHNQEWGFHTARVNCIAWSPDSSCVASGSLDCSVIVWSMDHPSKHVIVKNAHPQSQITRLDWLDNHTVVSVGQDCNVKVWERS